MAQEVVLFAENLEEARQEIELLGGRITHQLSSDIFVAKFPQSVEDVDLEQSSLDPHRELAFTEEIAISGWTQKKSLVDAAPPLSVSWDDPEHQDPEFYDDDLLSSGLDHLPRGLDESTGTSTSLYMIGSVAVGVVIVSGSRTELQISTEEATNIVAEVQEGLNFLATAEPRANVSFDYDIQFLTVDAEPGSTSECKQQNSYELCEAPWRDDALEQLGFSAGRQGSRDYVQNLRSTKKTEWAFVAYFTKYPLRHFAYAGGERIVMHYANDNWGPDQINQVFAHETCHIFGAADEYGSCSGGVSGYLDIPNNNCKNVTSNQLICLMNQNDLSLCEWSRKQIGWDDRLLPAEIDAVVKWLDSRVYFFKGSLVVSFKLGHGVEDGYPKRIADQWPDWPDSFQNGIDAAILWPTGKAYFFKGSQYIRITPGQGIDAGYPKEIAAKWKNWPASFDSGVDAAILWPTGKAYFFKGSEYLRYTPKKGVDSGFPKSIAAHWKKLPDNFEQRVDGAILWSDDAGYLFSGEQYLRYTRLEGTDAGYPRTIAFGDLNVLKDMGSEDDMAPMRAVSQCQAQTKKGAQCRNRVRDGMVYCYVHQP